jgi:hypothetical protein
MREARARSVRDTFTRALSATRVLVTSPAQEPKLSQAVRAQ